MSKDFDNEMWMVMHKNKVELMMMEIEQGAYDHANELLFRAPDKHDYVTALRSDLFEVHFEVATDFDGTKYIDWTLHETKQTLPEILGFENDIEEWPMELIQSHLTENKPNEDDED